VAILVTLTETKKHHRFENTGSIEACTWFRLMPYWVDGESNVVGKASVMPTVICDGAHWIQGTNITYYCKLPIPIVIFPFTRWSRYLQTQSKAIAGRRRQRYGR